MIALAYTDADGNAVIIYPMISKNDPPGFTQEMALERALKDVPQGKTAVQIDTATLPPRDFREAWTVGTSTVNVRMPKARNLHMKKIRQARKEKLAELDQEWMKKLGKKQQAEADAVEAARQVLRDLPQTLDLRAATTPEALKAIWPPELTLTEAASKP